MGKRKKNTSGNKGIVGFFSDERFKITLGLIIVGFSLLLLLAFISYLFIWKTDQSFAWENVISNPEVRVENWSGKVGAYFANIFINKWFGIGSLIFPFLFLLIGLRLMRIKLVPLGKTLRISIISVILLSVILGFIFSNSGGFLGSGPGGRHGYYISLWLTALLGKTGTSMLLIISVVTLVIFSNKHALEKIKEFTKFRFKRISLWKKNVGSDHETQSIKENEYDEDSDDLVFETEFPQREPSEKKRPPQPEKEEDDIKLTVEKIKQTEEDYNTSSRTVEDYDPTRDLSAYKFPSLDLLERHDAGNSSVTNEELISNKNKIVETLANYKIQIDKIKATIGPTVTLYEIVPAPGIRISKIKNLEDDIALNLAALGIRIIAPIPGRGTIGIEVPNQKPEIVSMRSILASRKFQESDYELAIALGKTISNETYVFDLAKMPHLLIAGATGQGKSVGLNAIITSLLYKKHPSQLKFVLVDPKKVELTLYSKIENHFLAKIPDADETIITDTQKVIYTLNSLTIEMDKRYELLKKAHVRNIKEYNQKFIKRRLNPENGHRYMPYIVVVVDEFADLIMTAGREVETPLARLAQLARAIGIHLVIATQRPTTNIITGVIKANFPARIAFRVTSMIDSRTILDSPGANQLIGRGDLLFAPGSEMTRLQCAFIDIPELERITDFIGTQRGFESPFILPEYVDESKEDIGEVDLSKKDSYFNDAARLVVAHQQGSTSLIQRKFSIGYNRAGRIIDQLEAAGIVGPFEGSKARHVLFPDEYSLEQYLNSLD